MTDISSYIDAHLDEALSQLADYVALPTVSAQRQSIAETAEFVRVLLEAVGATVEVVGTRDAIETVKVGGEAVTVLRGELDLERAG